MGCWSVWRRLLREGRSGSWRKFARLPWQERLLLCRAFLWLLAAEAALRCRPLPSLSRTLYRTIPASDTSALPLNREALRHLAHAMTIVDTHGPLAPSCLRRSLAMAWWLRRRGLAATMKIGVAKETRELRAHAWLTIDGPQPLRLFDEPEFADLRFPA